MSALTQTSRVLYEIYKHTQKNCSAEKTNIRGFDKRTVCRPVNELYKYIFTFGDAPIQLHMDDQCHRNNNKEFH